MSCGRCGDSDCHGDCELNGGLLGRLKEDVEDMTKELEEATKKLEASTKELELLREVGLASALRESKTPPWPCEEPNCDSCEVRRRLEKALKAAGIFIVCEWPPREKLDS